MKNKVWIILAAVFVGILVLAAVLYPKLSEKYAASNTPGSANSGEALQAEDFTVYNTNMEEVKLSDYFGKPVVINFWATWCHPCKSELPAFDAIYEKYKDDVAFLMVNLTDGRRDTVSGVEKFISDSGYRFPIYYDIEFKASNTYGVYSIPETVFINADGTLHDIRVGSMSDAVLEDYIQQMIGESK